MQHLIGLLCMYALATCNKILCVCNVAIEQYHIYIRIYVRTYVYIAIHAHTHTHTQKVYIRTYVRIIMRSVNLEFCNV